MIPVLFYTYGGVIGASPAWVNIAIFFVSAAVAYIYEAKLLRAEASRPCNKCLSLIFIFAIAILFVVFTFKTPEIGIFKDPVSGSYGI